MKGEGKNLTQQNMNEKYVTIDVKISLGYGLVILKY